MNPTFEFLGKGIEPDEREEHSKFMGEEVGLEREYLSTFSVEQGPEMRRWEGFLRQKYEKEWNDLGGEGTLDVPVFYIPYEHAAKIRGPIQEPGEGTGGALDAYSGSIILFLDEGPYRNLYNGRKLAHEFAHAYSRDVVRYKVVRKPGEITLSKAGFNAGMVVRSSPWEAGRFLEEWYAVERELGVHYLLPEYFPQENAAHRSALSKLVREGVIPDHYAPYIALDAVVKGEKHATEMVGTPEAHMAGSRLMRKVHNGIYLLRRARVSGKWSGLMQAVDAAWGPGTFKMIVQVDPQDSEVCSLVYKFFSVPDESQRAEIGKQIISRRKIPGTSEAK